MHSITPDETALVLTLLIVAVFLVGIVAVAIWLER
jgi:hypothetical protein